MNKHFIPFALIAGMLIATGCSDEQTTDNTDINEPVELQITPKVTLTRSVIDGGVQNANGATRMQNIAVYAQNATTNTAAKSNNYAIYKQSGGNWNASGSDEIYLTSEPATVYAYYPAYKPGNNGEYAETDALKLTGDDATATSTIPLTVYKGGAGTESDYTITAINNADKVYGSGWEDNTANMKKIASAPGEVDYMWATSNPTTVDNGKGTNPKGKNAALTMKHALALISFRVYNDGTYKYNSALTQIKLENVAAGTTLSDANGHQMNIATGKISAGSATAATYTRKVSGYTMIQVKAGTNNATTASTDEAAALASNKLSMLVLPAAAVAADQVKATFTIDGVDYSVNLTAPDGAKSWLQGMNYIYNVKLGGQGLTIGTITVTDWSPVDGGDMEIK